MSLKTTNVASGVRRDQPYKGRGASLNLEGRFEKWQRECFDDGWEAHENEQEDPPPKTIVTHEQAKSIINPVNSPDIPFRYSLNPYRGCEHVMWNSRRRKISGLNMGAGVSRLFCGS